MRHLLPYYPLHWGEVFNKRGKAFFSFRISFRAFPLEVMTEYEKCPYCDTQLTKTEHKSYYHFDMTSPITEVVLTCNKCNKEMDIADWYEDRAIDSPVPITNINTSNDQVFNS